MSVLYLPTSRSHALTAVCHQTAEGLLDLEPCDLASVAHHLLDWAVFLLQNERNRGSVPVSSEGGSQERVVDLMQALEDSVVAARAARAKREGGSK